MARKSATTASTQQATLVPDLVKPTSVACPFKIVIDTREQRPYDFLGVSATSPDDGLPAVPPEDDPGRWIPYEFKDIPSNAETGRLPWEIETITFGLDVGDYSLALAGEETSPPAIRIERKSKADLYSSVAKRDNFEWRLERLDEETESAHIVVESEWSEIITQPPRFSDYNPTALHRTIQSWTHRYSRVHWWFYPGRDAAEMATFWLLFHFWRNLHYHRTNKARKEANHKAYLKGMMAYRNRVKITDCPIERQHAIGDAADHWARGWLDIESLSKGKIR